MEFNVLLSTTSSSEVMELNVQYGEEVDVADWFTGFCAVYQVGGLTQQPAEPGESPPKKAKRDRPRGSKKVFQVCSSISGSVDLVAFPLWCC